MKQFLSTGSEQQKTRQAQPAANLARTAHTQGLMDNRPELLVQRKLKETINAGPKMLAQRKLVAELNNSPRMVAQRELHTFMNRSAVQLQAVPEEENLLQGKFKPVQKMALDEEKPIQGKFATAQLTTGDEEKPLQQKPNHIGLPDNLKNGIENLSGYSMDDVKVHYNSDKPAQLNAHAYAQGTDIHVAPGQEQHLPHEAWHVVQQKQGRVRPTVQMKAGVPVNDDVGLESEADVMGTKAVNMKVYDVRPDPITHGISFIDNSSYIQKKVNNSAVTNQQIGHLSYFDINRGILDHKSSGTTQLKNMLRTSIRENSQVIQRVGGEKISFDKSHDNHLKVIEGLNLLQESVNEMRILRARRKKEIWRYIENLPNRDNISTKYSSRLEELNDEIALLQNTPYFKDHRLTIDPNDMVQYHDQHIVYDIATVQRGDAVFRQLDRRPDGTRRDVFTKGDGDKHYIKDSRGTLTRRYAYVEKNYWQFMEFIHTHHMEGRYQKFLRAGNDGKGRPDVLNNDDDIVKRAQRINFPQLTLEQLAFVHQYWGSGSQQRGLSLTSTPKPGVTIGNEGENFRTDGGFLIKIDLAKISARLTDSKLINHYAYGGTKNVIQNNGGSVNTDPFNKQNPYRYRSSVIKNRELYLEYLKPEWIVEVEYHPDREDEPGTGRSIVINRSDFDNYKEFIDNVSDATGAQAYYKGFMSALAEEPAPKRGGKDFEKGRSSGKEYLKGYEDGQKDRASDGSLVNPAKYKANTKKRSLSRHKKNKLNKENKEKEKELLDNERREAALLTINNPTHKDKTDLYRVGYVQGRAGQNKITNIRDLYKNE